MFLSLVQKRYTFYVNYFIIILSPVNLSHLSIAKINSAKLTINMINDPIAKENFSKIAVF